MKYLYPEKPAYDQETETISPDYKIENGVFIAGWKVEKKPDEDGYTPTTEEIADMEPAPVPELTPAEQREQAYNTERVIRWDGELLSVTEAAQKWAYYAAEGRTDKTDKLTALIAAAKASIRAQYPDT